MKAHDLARLLLAGPNLRVFEANVPEIREIINNNDPEVIAYKKALNKSVTFDQVSDLIKDWDAHSYQREFIVL